MIEAFTVAGKHINNALNTIVNSMQSEWVSGLLFTAQIGITLYLVVYGYSVIAGKKEVPIKDLIWDLCRFAIILTFLSGANGWLTLVGQAVDGIKEFLSGTTNLDGGTYASLDRKLESFVTLVVKTWDQNDWYVGLILIPMCIPLLLGIVAFSVALIFTDITLKVLLATAPIFIFCLMWGFLKGSFAQWVEAILGNCLVLLFINIFSKIGFKLATYATTNSFDDVFTSPILLMVAGTMTMFSVKYGRDMAFSLVKVAVDSSIGGSASNMNEGKLLTKGSKGAYKGAKGAYKRWFKG
ncbi:type IV secretion system protein [Pasteurella atlantica]|uniref:type IV secretion system protein n=1 Tax=Phocoenobacter atlanticus TaxID=3416742 RepID=UPI00275F9FD6|nr:type IV secretion system protein [Pasteurella atlantica]MDP8042534.1 type IV secretion system protein [Pasteurella atlantica]